MLLRLALALLVLASPDAADWEMTRWGMTPEDVAAATGGAARVVPPTSAEADFFGLVAIMAMEHVSDGVTHDARSGSGIWASRT